ncbi:MAG: hypothetical protein AAFX79_06690 [Planctomycetota bacterium]
MARISASIAHAVGRASPGDRGARTDASGDRIQGLAPIGVVWPPLAALAALLGVVLGLAIAGWPAHWSGGIAVEGGPIEGAQLWVWMLALLLLTRGMARGLRGEVAGWTGRDAWHLGWLMVLSGLAVLREFDAHVVLNPEVLGDWGVRYRLDWWLAADSPVLPRIAWAIAGALGVAAVVVPPVVFRARVFALLRRLDLASILMAAGVALVVAGYLSDDVLGRDQFVPTAYMQMIEEGAELVGVAFVLCAMRVVAARPLAVREGRAAA